MRHNVMRVLRSARQAGAPGRLTRNRTWVSRPMVSRGAALACRTNASMSMTRRSADSRQIAPSRASRTDGCTTSPSAGTAAARRACSRSAQGCSRWQAVAPTTASRGPAAGAGSPVGAAAGAASAAGAAAAAGAASPAAAGSLTAVNWDRTLRRDSKFLRCPSRAPAATTRGGWAGSLGVCTGGRTLLCTYRLCHGETSTQLITQ